MKKYFRKMVILLAILFYLGIGIPSLAAPPSPQPDFDVDPGLGGSGAAIVGETFLEYTDAKVYFDDVHTLRSVENGTAGSIFKIIEQDPDGTRWTRSFPTHAYNCFLVNATLDAPYQSRAVGYLYKGCERSVTYTVSESTTYEKSLSTTLEMMGSIQKQLMIYLDLLQACFSTTTEINASLTSSTKSENTIINTTSETLTYPIYEDGYYFSQRRATFKIYVTISFEIIYKQKTYRRQMGTGTQIKYEYNVDYYKVSEITVYYALERDYGEFLSRYERLDDGTCVYAGPKDHTDFIYI